MVALVLIASLAAATSYGRPFPSLFVDPFGDFSVVYLPDWSVAGAGVVPSEPVRADPSPATSALGGAALDDAVADAAAAGRESIDLVVGSPAATRRLVMPLRAIGAAEIFWFFVLYLLMAGVLLWSGVAVVLVAGRRVGARAYFALAAVGFVFLVTFFDYHTTRWLSPLFAASTLGNSLAIGAVAWCFPEPPQVGRRAKAAALTLLACGVLACVVLGLAPVAGWDIRALRVAASASVPAALVWLSGSVAFRLRRATGRGRGELRTAAIGLLAVPAVVAVAFVVVVLTGVTAFHMLLPFVALAMPAAIGYGLIRHNVLGVRAVVTRGLFVVPLVLTALAVGGIAWWASDGADRPAAPGPWGLASLVASGTAFAGWTSMAHLIYPARARFQPTIQELADQLAILRDAAEIRLRLADLVARFLPTRGVRVLDADSPEATTSGEGARPSWLGEDPWDRELVVPLRSGGERLGVIVIEPKVDGALFTDEELRLVQTIAGLGALAIHNATVLGELEARRAVELLVTRGDRRLAVDAVAAEVAHELAYPLGFLRHFLRQVGQGRATDEQLRVGEDEVARLERMLAWVRRLQRPVPVLRPVRLRTVCERALVLLRAEIDDRGQTCEFDVPVDLLVEADPDPVLQAVANLLRNATQAAPIGGRVGVRALHVGTGAVLEIWDDGPGVPEADVGRIFTPWYTTKPDGSGLGLAVVQRVTATFGWSIALDRVDGRTVFRLSFPTVARADVPTEEGAGDERPRR